MKTISLLITILLISACSGGGGGGTSPATPAPAPAPPPDERSLLLPAGSTAAFESYLREGLKQWSGLSNNSSMVQQTLTTTRLPVLGQPEAVLTASALDAGAAPVVSQTNLVVAGVDEVDLARYDGDYVYLANQDRLQVIRATPGSAKAVVATSRLTRDGSSASRGLYHLKDATRSRLVNVRGAMQYSTWDTLFFAPWDWHGTTGVDFVDVDSPDTPAVAEQLSIDGSYVNSRRIGNMLYLVTRFTPEVPGIVPFATTDAEKAANQAIIDSIDVADLLPRVRFSDGSDAPLVTSSACFVPLSEAGDAVYFPTVTTITAIDITAPANFSSLCMAEGVTGMFVSQQAIYLAAYQSSILPDDTYFEASVIHKIGIGNGAPTYIGSGRVPGTFWGDPAFLMGEHDGNLTAITTVTGNNFSHRLTVLGESTTDFKLDVLGQIPNASRTAPIGKPGEQIFASRIVGDRAYVVTFEQIDPVYVIDLASPTDPVILGELEIPGFSTYLHPISENLLLGVGKDSITQDGTAWFQGANVRLFDVSNPASLTVLADLKIGRRGTDSPVMWDAHAFTSIEVDGVHRIAMPFRVAGAHLPASDNATAHYPWTENVLYLLEVDEAAGTLAQVGKMVTEDHLTGDRYQPNCCAWSERSFMNGDTVYHLAKSRLFESTWDNPAVTSNLFFPTLFINPENTASTTELRDGLIVGLFDANTREYLTCATVTASDGDVTVPLRTGCADEAGQGLLERAGIFSVNVQKDGYAPWSTNDVRVQADQHHVGTTVLNIYLSPL